MKMMKHIQTWLLITLLALSANGVVNAKAVSGHQNLSGDLHQSQTVLNALLHQGLGEVSTTNTSESPLATKGPIAGGGAKLDNLSPGEIKRIQNAANRTNQEITLVGSRASKRGGNGVTSDYDYVLSGKSSQRHSARSSLPRGTQGGEVNSLGNETGIDIWQSYNPKAPGFSPVNTSQPHIIFKPGGG